MLELITDKGSELERKVACLVALFGEFKLIEGCSDETRIVVQSLVRILEELPEDWKREICFEVLSQCK